MKAKTFLPRAASAGLLALAVYTLSAGPAGAAGPQTCTAGLRIFSTSTGTVTQAGNVTVYHDSGVGGSYTSGFLQGYAINGSQDIIMNSRSGSSQVAGHFTATGPDGTLIVRYTGAVDATGKATGHFAAQNGTGRFSRFQWAGDIDGQAVGPATFQATDSGICSGVA